MLLDWVISEVCWVVRVWGSPDRSSKRKPQSSRCLGTSMDVIFFSCVLSSMSLTYRPTHACSSICGTMVSSHIWKKTLVIRPIWDLQSDTYKCNTMWKTPQENRWYGMEVESKVLNEGGTGTHLSPSFSPQWRQRLARYCSSGHYLVSDHWWGCEWLGFYVDEIPDTNLIWSYTCTHTRTHPPKAPFCPLLKSSSHFSQSLEPSHDPEAGGKMLLCFSCTEITQLHSFENYSAPSDWWFKVSTSKKTVTISLLPRTVNSLALRT